jgi:hypothetical protein
MIGDVSPMNNEPVTIKFKYNFNDLIQGFRIYRKGTLSHKIVIALGIIFILFGIWYYLELGFNLSSILLFIFAIILLTDLVRHIRIWLAYKRNEQLYTAENEVTFTESAIDLKTPRTEAQNKWTAYSDLLEDKELFLLVYGKWLYSIIPKRAFKDSEELDRVRILFLEHLEKAR